MEYSIGKQGETVPPGSRKATFAEACGLVNLPLFTDAIVGFYKSGSHDGHLPRTIQ